MSEAMTQKQRVAVEALEGAQRPITGCGCERRVLLDGGSFSSTTILHAGAQYPSRTCGLALNER
jgi:hypothetical protein